MPKYGCAAAACRGTASASVQPRPVPVPTSSRPHRTTRISLPCAVVLAAMVATGAGVGAQAPAPGGSAAPLLHLLREGSELLDREDPVAAWRAFRGASELAQDDAACLIGLGRTHLMLGCSVFAQRYAEAAIAREPANQDAMALCVRALIRGRQFDEAVRAAGQFLLRADQPGPELLASRASAMFRVQRTEDAAASYRRVVAIDPLHA
jgi:tetratricopeptide (TPR) repeat protein